MDGNASTQPLRQSADEIDLVQLVLTVWRGRGIIAGTVVLCLMLAGLFLGYEKLKTVYGNYVQSYIALNGFVDGAYPNGASFSPTDLLSDEVLSSVTSQGVFSDLSAEQIRSATQANFGSPATAAIRREWEVALQNAETSGDQIAAINAQYQDQLERLNSTTVSLTVYPEKLGIDATAATALASLIPQAWQDVFVDRYRFVLPSNVISAAELNPPSALTDTRQLLQAQQYLFEASRNMEVAAEDARLASLRTANGLNASELTYQIKAFTSFYLNPLLGNRISRNDPFLEARLRELQLETQRITSLLQSNTDSIVQLVALQNRDGNVQRQPSAVGDPAATTLSLNDSGLSSVIDLAQQAQLNQYMVSLFDRDWELNTQLADLEYQIAQFNTQSSMNVEDLRTVASAEFISLSENIDSLLSVWVDEGLRSAGQLFAVQAPPQLYSGAGSVTPKMALTLALALVLGVFVGIVVVLLRGAVRPAV